MDAHQLSRSIDYCPQTGRFSWRLDVPRVGGRDAGSIDAQGYLILCVKGLRIKAHRAAWLLTHGQWPTGPIDHINAIRTDNRIANLRVVTPGENRQNQRRVRSDSKTGFANTSAKNGRFRAVIRVNGKHRYFGVYDTPEAAHAAAVEAKRAFHPAFAG